MTGSVPVAVVGGGHMGRIHARRLRERTDAHLVAVVDPRPDLREDLPWAHRVPAEAQAVIVATPTSTHREVAEPLLAAGLPVLVEKPLAATAADAEALARHPGLSVGHLERFNPALAALPPGNTRYVRAERLGPFAGRGADVDVVLDLMIHDLDLVLWRCGAAIHEVRAVGLAVLSGDVDLAEAWIELDGGAVATLSASRVSRQPSRKLRALVDGAWYSLDLVERTALRVAWQDGPAVESLPVPPGDAVTRMHDAFLSRVLGEPDPRCADGAAGLAAVELALRVGAVIRGRAG